MDYLWEIYHRLRYGGHKQGAPETGASTMARPDFSAQVAELNARFVWPEPIRPFPDSQRTELMLFPSQSDRTLIVIPGWNSSVKKFKYAFLVDTLQQRELASVVIMNNPDPGLEVDYTEQLMQQVEAVTQFSIANQSVLNGNRGKLKLSVLGSSSGGGAAAAIAGRYNETIDSVFLVGPAQDVPFAAIADDMQNITGELFLIRGEHDHYCTADNAMQYLRMAPNALTTGIAEIGRGDHGLSSAANAIQMVGLVTSQLLAVSQKNS
jgi:pimeloyl-ACP methyl ester carboxylesterase